MTKANMNNKRYKMNFIDTEKKREKKREKVTLLVEEFVKTFEPIEKDIIVITDECTESYFIEVHVKADKIVINGTIDVPLDPEEQGEYRANRDVLEDHAAFLRMKDDSKNGRVFSNIVTEYNLDFDEAKPLKIIGGQHRYLAIKESLGYDVNKLHGIKVYFDLNREQRLDVQLISNTNIAVASDLLDRMFETVKGPELRNWSHQTDLLLEGQDFSDKKERTSVITVRLARTFLLSYYEGRKYKNITFDRLNPSPIVAKTGVVDESWELLRSTIPSIFLDEKIIQAAKQYALLHKAQYAHYLSKKKGSSEYAHKAMTYPVLSSWAFIAGFLEDNEVRLKRHFDLSNNSSTDPLNSASMAKGRHKTDPENYRGLGTRTDKKELGRLSELFYLQTEKGSGISQPLIDLAIKKYHAKIASIEVMEAEKKLG
jgi:hypothetical protein